MPFLDDFPGGQRLPDRRPSHAIVKSVHAGFEAAHLPRRPRLTGAARGVHMRGLWLAGTLSGPDLHKNKSWPVPTCVEAEFARAFLAGFAAWKLKEIPAVPLLKVASPDWHPSSSHGALLLKLALSVVRFVARLEKFVSSTAYVSEFLEVKELMAIRRVPVLGARVAVSPRILFKRDRNSLAIGDVLPQMVE